MTALNGNAPHGRQSGEVSNQIHSKAILHDLPYQVKSFEYPDPHTVKGRVLGALLRSERLTHLDCWVRFGSARLSHHVHKLRRAGWPVKMDERSVSTTDAGRHATIGVYHILPEDIAKAAEAGQSYAYETAEIEDERKAIGRRCAHG